MRRRLPLLKSLVPMEEIVAGVKLVAGLPGFLRNSISASEAREVLRQRLERREADFLRLVRRTVYEFPASPYRELLKLAGCEFGDVEKLVQQDGIEGTLRALFRGGVYVTTNEIKGRQPLVRGSRRFAFKPARFRNPLVTGHVTGRSGGSRGEPVPVTVHFAHMREQAVDEYLWLLARGAAGWSHANWCVPGSWTIRYVLRYCAFGAVAERWFLQLDPQAPRVHPRYAWSVRVARWAALAAGLRLPRPEYVAPDNPMPIVRWMADLLGAGGTPHVYAPASSIVRLCEAAFGAGVSLRGAQLDMGSEAITPARMALARRTGAIIATRYGANEAGNLGYGCLAPECTDDIHFLHDMHAVIQAVADGPPCALPAEALLISSLSLTSPLILINASLGDQAVLAERHCGCPLESLGWKTHVHTIRSFEKLTAGGMNLLDADVIRILEEVLPARFGGGPTDYQLTEEEGADGRHTLRLLVHPSIGPLDPKEVGDAFLSAVGSELPAARITELLWRHSDFLRIERTPPRPTFSGKILHLYMGRDRADQKTS